MLICISLRSEFSVVVFVVRAIEVCHSAGYGKICITNSPLLELHHLLVVVVLYVVFLRSLGNVHSIFYFPFSRETGI